MVLGLPERIVQVKAFKRGMGLKYLLNAAFEVLGNPILMFDMEYKLIAYCGEEAIGDPIWDEIVKTGRFGEATVGFFLSESFIDDIASSQAIAYLESDNLTWDRYVGKVYSRDCIVVANVVIVSSNKPFDPYDAVLFELVCAVLSKEAATIAHYQSYALSYQDSLIAMLINGEISDRALYAGHMANIYSGLCENLFVGVVDISNCDPEFAKLSHYRSLFMQAEPAFRYSIYGNHIVIIIGSDRESLSIKKELSKLNKLFRQRHIHAGVSDWFDNLYELAKYYRKAASALMKGKTRATGQHIFFAGEEA